MSTFALTVVSDRQVSPVGGLTIPEQMFVTVFDCPQDQMERLEGEFASRFSAPEHSDPEKRLQATREVLSDEAFRARVHFDGSLALDILPPAQMRVEREGDDAHRMLAVSIQSKWFTELAQLDYVGPLRDCERYTKLVLTAEKVQSCAMPEAEYESVRRSLMDQRQGAAG